MPEYQPRYYAEYDRSAVVINDRMWIIYDRLVTFGRGDPMPVAKCWSRDRANEITQRLNTPITDAENDDPVLGGLNLLASLTPGKRLDLRSEHDQIWAGVMDFSAYIELMTEEQVRQMTAWGWFEDEDSWSCSV